MIKLLGKKIENGMMPLVIAEIGVNHNGDKNLAKTLIQEAKTAGCDVVKFQSWTKDTLFAKSVYEANKDLDDELNAMEMHEDTLRAYKGYCDDLGVAFLSTPFSNDQVDFLVDELGVDFIKIASMDLNNYPFLDYVARKGKTVILSTGLSTIAEVDEAIRVIEQAGNSQIIILHCVALYPPQDEEVNLKNIQFFQNTYPYPVGFSDHTLGTTIPLAAVALGACVIEKHFTLDKSLPGPDHAVSATPEEMKSLVDQSKRIVTAMGTYRRSVGASEHEKREAFRRSIVTSKALEIGHVIRLEDLSFKRPGTGLSPEVTKYLVGQTIKVAIGEDELLTLDHV